MEASVLSMKTIQNGLTVKAYRADGSVLLAFDLDPALTTGLAGFAVQCTQPDGKSYELKNKLDFTTPVTNQMTPDQDLAVPSSQAPFQKFHWVYFPPEVMPGEYIYTITAMQFGDGNSLQPGPSAQVGLELVPIQSGPLEIGFTRGFLSSQAYAERFKNAPFEPSPRGGLMYDTSTYQPQYQWLGARAREMMFSFLAECLNDPTVTLDLFAYDLDEPDIINQFIQMGSRLRAVLDNCPEHTKPGAIEPLAQAALQQSAGSDHIVVGHFDRFSHSKVLIMKKNGTPVKVLAGSANFSIRGLYVQANNVFIFDDPTMASYYEQAFQTAFTSMKTFHTLPIASQWFDLPAQSCQPYSVCFSPHTDAALSIGRMNTSIQNAQSSVLFAVMELSGGGDVMKDLLSLETRPSLFSYGISQSIKGISLYKPGSSNAILTEFTALDKNVPPPFNKEWTGGVGQVIHHKFVVVDFNGPNPVLYTGSSNLSTGGEMANGDNLVAIYDPVIVQAYAVEAIRLVEHYHFRSNQAQATQDNPILLKGNLPAGQEWWRPYYDPQNIKCLERSLFVD